MQRTNCKKIARLCSPNFIVRATALPNDPSYNSLWGLSSNNGIDAPSAWNISKGSNNIVVAVVDTGIDYNHPDLKDNMWINTNEIPNNGIDDDNNGYIDDIHGISAFGGTPFDDNFHGTHVAGTIGARGNNSTGVTGINWNVKLMALKHLNKDGSGNLATSLEVVNYLIKMKQRGVNVRFANNSWASYGYSEIFQEAVTRAQEAGIIFIGAAGNSTLDNDIYPSYPANHSGVVSVAAIDSNQNLAYFSNFGHHTVDIAAPGVNILSTKPGNNYLSINGTSMAAPHVTGALALLAAANPSMSNQQLIDRMYQSAIPSETLEGITKTGRKLNVGRMLNNQTIALPPTPALPTPCHYDVSNISYNPDFSADSKAIVLQGDFGFPKKIDLDFVFPYYGQAITKVFVSVNGMIYLNSRPPYSYFNDSNGKTAHPNSISALHTDLVQSSNPYGVRVSSTNQKFTIYWKTQVYGFNAPHEVQIRTTLYKSGEIRSFIDFSSQELENFVKRNATVGINGYLNHKDFTYAYNDSNIKDHLALSYKPQCGISVPKINSINAKTTTKKGKKISKALPKKKLKITLNGQGNGTAQLKLGLDGQSCSSTISAYINNGKAVLTGRIPRSISGYRFLNITAGKSNKRVKVKKKEKET